MTVAFDTESNARIQWVIAKFYAICHGDEFCYIN